MLFTVIVHADRSQRATLRRSVQSVDPMEFMEFDTDGDALQWLRGSTRTVDFFFTSWELNQEKRDRLSTLRELPQAAAALVFLIGSRRDLDWICTLFHTPGIIEGLAAKPFRVSTFLRDVQSLLLVDLMTKPCALVVEDDPETRGVIRDYLKEFGFSKVVEAGNGKEAVAELKVRGTEVSVVLSDWHMPLMTGIELLKHLRQTPALARIPFLMLTSRTPTEQIKTIRAAELGVNGYLLKPFTLDSFHSQMESLIQEVSKHRRAEAYHIAARTLLAQGSGRAEETMNEALKLFPTEPTLWETMGDIHCFRQKSDKSLPQAVEAYEHALRLAPMNTPLLMKCFECYTMLGRMNEAVRILRTHLSRAELDDGLFTRLGKIYFQNGEYSAASDEFRRAISSNPGNTEAQALNKSAIAKAKLKKSA